MQYRSLVKGVSSDTTSNFKHGLKKQIMNILLRTFVIFMKVSIFIHYSKVLNTKINWDL